MPMPRFRAAPGEFDRDRLAVHFDGAAVRPDDARQRFHQRRFAGAVFADDGMNGAAFDLQIHILESCDAAVALGQIAHGEDGTIRH